jgi:hypothetical protein
MKRYIILACFVAFSVCLFFILRELYLDLFVSGYKDIFTQLGKVMDIIPYWFGLFSAMLVAISSAGVLIFRRTGHTDIYKGFVYSFRYSLTVTVVAITFLLCSYL